MDLIRKVDKILTKTVETVLSIMFILIFLMVFNQVVLRYVFNTSIMGTAEIFTMLFSYSSALGAAVMVRNREHIRISVFIDKLPLTLKKIVITIDYMLIVFLSTIIVKESIPWLIKIRTFVSPITGISRTVESITIPIAFGLIIFYCIFNTILIYLIPEELNLETSEADIEVKVLLDEAAEADRSALERQQKHDAKHKRGDQS